MRYECDRINSKTLTLWLNANKWLTVSVEKATVNSMCDEKLAILAISKQGKLWEFTFMNDELTELVRMEEVLMVYRDRDAREIIEGGKA